MRWPESAFFAELPAAQITPRPPPCLKRPPTSPSGRHARKRRLRGLRAPARGPQVLRLRVSLHLLTADALLTGPDRMRAGHCLYGCFRCPAEPASRTGLPTVTATAAAARRPLLLIDFRRDVQSVAEAVSRKPRAASTPRCRSARSSPRDRKT
ncbi:MAG: hypothetical protein ACLVL7_10025 [Anaerotruncus massiliensis (ex Togo et al. 2019)]